MAQDPASFVVAVDVGTTNLTCHVFDRSGISKYGAVRKVCMVYIWNIQQIFLTVYYMLVSASGIELLGSNILIACVCYHCRKKI